MAKPKLRDGGGTVTVRVPISIRKRGGRRLVLAPDGADVTTAPARRHVDSAMVKATARAFRWREMLENGTHATIAEIADAEKINESYVGRVLRLTLLAPEIVEAILNGRQPPGLQLEHLLRRFPVEWGAQGDGFGLIKDSRTLTAIPCDTDPTRKALQFATYSGSARLRGDCERS